MELKVFRSLTKTLLALKLLILLMTVASLQLSATGYGQSITLSLKNAPLENAFKEIKRQSGYSFVYTRDQLKKASPVTMQVTGVALTAVLDLCFQNQSLTYVIEDRYIIVQTKKSIAESLPSVSPIDIKGRVKDENGRPIAGATVTITGSKIMTITDTDGMFGLSDLKPGDILMITAA